MWQRFTERARKVVFYAQEEATRFSHGYVGPEHLLLGILREEDNVGCRILTLMGVQLETVGSQVLEAMEWGEARRSSDMTLTPQAKRTIDLAYQAARKLDNDYIGTEHLMLGIIEDPKTIAGRIMQTLGVTVEAAFAITTEIQTSAGEANAKESVATPVSHERNSPELRAVYSHAEAFATELGAGYVATEHLLTGILAEPANVGSRALRSLGVQPDQLLGAIKPYLYREGFGPQVTVFTPRAKAVLDATLALAAEESKLLGPRPAHSGHLIIALARDGEGLAGRTLAAQGLTAEALEKAVAEVAKD